MLRWIFWGAGSAIAVISAAGLLAPWLPALELPNHFRLYYIAAAALLTAASLAVRDRRAAGFLAVVLAVNVLLALPAVTVLSASHAGERAGPEIKIATFNLWTTDRAGEITDYVAAEAPDLIALQELNPEHEKDLLPRLRAAYPFQHVCTPCGIALLAKTPLTDARIDARGGWVAASWTAGDGRPVRVFSVHLSWPFQPVAQALDIDALIETMSSVREPVIVAGDFNLTPWSFKLSKLAWQTGLKRHGTLWASWPVFERFRRLGALSALPLPPAVLIDNVLTSPAIEGVAFAVGPDLGSDHRPVVARLRLQR